MAKKTLAVLLAMLMLLCAVPFTSFADDEVATAEETVSSWDANYALVLEKLAANEKSATWQYVDQNQKTISDKMITLTAFALYDDAWANGIDKKIDVDTAEKMLVSIIEKVDTGIGESKVAEIVKVLQTAKDINDLLQKVNNYVNVSDVLKSAEWSTAFKVIEASIKIGNFYEEERDKIIDAYARILAVSAANDFYLDFLQYIVDTTSYDVLKTAASNLITKINSSIADLVGDEFKALAVTTGSIAVQKALEAAMNSNAYTAVALKVYQVGTSVADALWNTSDLYPLMQELYTIYFVQTAAAGWYNSVVANGNADNIVYAVNALLSLREIGVETVYNLKNAENEGIVGKIKNQINYNISFEFVTEKAFLELAREVLFNTAIEDATPVNTIVTVNSNAYVHTDDTSLFNEKGITADDNGVYSVFFNDGTSTYVKTLFINEDKDISIKYAADTKATVIIEKNSQYGIVDASLTDEALTAENEIVIDTADMANYTVNANGEATVKALNDEFVYPEYNPVTASTVATAAGQVVANEARVKVLEIKDFINQIIETIKNFFATIMVKTA